MDARGSGAGQGEQTLPDRLGRAGLSQTQLARRMKTAQSYVARIEGGKVVLQPMRWGDLTFELIEGDVYVGGYCLGHGPVVRTLLQLVADRAATPPPGFIRQLWDALPESKFETMNGELWIGGQNYGGGWHAYLLLLLLAHPPGAV